MGKQVFKTLCDTENRTKLSSSPSTGWQVGLGDMNVFLSLMTYRGEESDSPGARFTLFLSDA